VSRTARRRWLRERAEARAAEGLPPKQAPRKTHYRSGEIRAQAQGDIDAMRAQMRARRENKLTSAEHAALDTAASGKRQRSPVKHAAGLELVVPITTSAKRPLIFLGT
jgi:hypothetical protein